MDRKEIHFMAFYIPLVAIIIRVTITFNFVLIIRQLDDM